MARAAACSPDSASLGGGIMLLRAPVDIDCRGLAALPPPAPVTVVRPSPWAPSRGGAMPNRSSRPTDQVPLLPPAVPIEDWRLLVAWPVAEPPVGTKAVECSSPPRSLMSRSSTARVCVSKSAGAIPPAASCAPAPETFSSSVRTFSRSEANICTTNANCSSSLLRRASYAASCEAGTNVPPPADTAAASSAALCAASKRWYVATSSSLAPSAGTGGIGGSMGVARLRLA
mmetsp:Transcript_23747/g.60122  ORF Transcript_23747/g.60122 Transcript_23747/m.60122 type:complete len:230 (+) Transcript_23747:621-1310(+)